MLLQIVQISLTVPMLIILIILLCTGELTKDKYLLLDKRAHTHCSWYDSSVCSSSEVVTTRGYVNNYCLQATASASLQFEFPIYNIWTSSATCTGSVEEQAEVPESCLLSDDDGYVPYGTYNNWVLYSTSSSNDNNSLSDGEIAGIVIGSVAAVAIVVGLIYYFVFYKSTGPLNQQAESKV